MTNNVPGDTILIPPNNATVDVVYRIIEGDCLKRLAEFKARSVDCIFVSPFPPETTPYIAPIVEMARSLLRVLKDEGSFWLELSESHNPVTGELHLFTFELALDILKQGWMCRECKIWHKPPTSQNKYDWDPKGEASIRGKHDYSLILRFVKRGHGTQTYFDKTTTDAWSSAVMSAPVRDVKQGEIDSGYPHEIIKDCLLMTCPEGGVVLDPQCGWGATGVSALECGMNFIGIERDRSMINKITKRLAKVR
jgi:DNA modification methylase